MRTSTSDGDEGTIICAWLSQVRSESLWSWLIEKDHLTPDSDVGFIQDVHTTTQEAAKRELSSSICWSL